ncbi:hypothetical protein [Cohnella thermotolerans]|uniref:hypothetical protein n=1 Tax=Cohnella thermotolerans TaxID=329858 RepID=UPI00047AE794|nr:hypothetical protein [Cohnella thermotolerans]
MEAIIEFLIRHYYVVIVVVGLVYGMFFRKSPLEKPNPNRRMPDFGGGGELRRPRQAPPGGSARKRAAEETARPAAPGPERSPGPEGEPLPLGRSERERTLPRSERSPESRPRPGWLEARPAELPPQRTEAEQRPSRSAAAPSDAPATTVSRPADGLGVAARLEEAERTRESPARSIGELPASAAEAPGIRLPRDEWSRAVVLAEILGPPRARKPYRR